MTKTTTIEQSKRIQRRMERLFLAKVYKALQSQIKAFTRDLKLNGVDYAKGRLSRDILNAPIGPVIKQIHRMSAISNANHVYSRLKKYEVSLKYRTFGFNERWTQDVNRYFRLHLLEKAVIPISDTTKKQILSLLEKATEEGWSVEQVVKELETSDITRMRARRIVRTETVRATNFGGMLGAYESKLVMEKEWISAHDVRVRGTNPEDKHSHLGLNGMTTDLLKPFRDPRSGEEIMFPGDPEASAGNTINCFLPDQLSNVNKRMIKHAFKNWYKGDVVTIQTSNGNSFTCTPNHPILTTDGWVAAGNLTNAYYLVKSDLLQLGTAVNLNVNHVPSTFEQIFDSLLQSGDRIRVSSSVVNFYGDRPASDVDVIRANSKLSDRIKSNIRESIHKNTFQHTDFRPSSLFRYSLFASVFVMKFFRQVSNSFISLSNKFLSILYGSLCHPYQHRFALASQNNTILFKPVSNNIPVNRKVFSKSINADTIVEHLADLGFVKVNSDRVIECSSHNYEGFVYTLETDNQMYDINSYVARNCRCVLGFKPKRDRNGRLIRKPETSITNTLVDVLAGALLGFELGEFINSN